MLLKSRKIMVKSIKLRLHHETIALLTEDQLQLVGGASGTTCTTTSEKTSDTRTSSIIPQ